WGNIPNMINAARKVKLRTDDGRLLVVRGTAFQAAKFRGDQDTGLPSLELKVKGKQERFAGDEALRLAGRLLPAINVSGGGRKAVQAAVQSLDASRGSAGYLEEFFAGSPATGKTGKFKPVSALPAPDRLALEMALHEEAERRAIQGELGVLKAAWEEAEAIASIADRLLVPEVVEAKLAELKRDAPRDGTPP
ncbi:MAG: hypothetical protein KJZ47_02210, partial [Gemmatimonadales bacterium]|nr:hypothetical protein [Gemmatimonadales bacterium]